MQPEEVWGDVLPHLLQADLRIVNLECALTSHRNPWTRSWKMFHFRADPKTVRASSEAAPLSASLSNASSKCCGSMN